MIRRSIATPCPIPVSLDQQLSTSNDDTTTNFDFTTELRASFRDAKPKRRSRQTVQFTIHEDEEERKTGVNISRSSLSQPPRRIQTKKQSQNAIKENTSPNTRLRYGSDTIKTTGTSQVRQAPKRFSIQPSTVTDRSDTTLIFQSMPPTSEHVQPNRRGTIYIPNEDTTMPSMYMGIFSPIKDLKFPHTKSDQSAMDAQVELTGIAAQMAMKRSYRQSILGGVPKRGTLQPTTKPVQETARAQDRYGQGGGKENVPPGRSDMTKCSNTDEEQSPSRSSTKISLPYGRCLSISERSNIYAPTASSNQKREPPRSSIGETGSRPAWNGGPKLRQSQPQPTFVSYRNDKTASPRPIVALSPEPRAPRRFIVPTVQQAPTLPDYAVLPEDINDPAMYEENWLHHQEIAITQLVNNLFSASRSDIDYDLTLRRCDLLRIYGSTSVVHKRLQASLLYGALSIPQDKLDQGRRLQTDLGLRKQFTDLWLNTYDLSVLELCLEIVVGRECRPRAQLLKDSSSPSLQSKTRLRNFIEAMLIRNEGAQPPPDTSNIAAWSYQRTVCRSLMLVKLLDLTKTETTFEMKKCLFQPGSIHKSSVSVLQHLTQILNPAAGDPTRALGHINYHISHVQNPLEEFDYQIENLATDLRDGTRLTRLVELLLYPDSSDTLLQQQDEGTTTILMPEGERIEFSNGQNRPLSRRLKVPCQSKTVKIWNVQLALSALANVKGISSLVEGITAEDIVNGYREKSIKLLWALVGKWGLSGLINWQDLQWETRRLISGVDIVQDDDELDDDVEDRTLSFEACKRRLKKWARAVAESRGIQIRNFTTSFADGGAFEAIVDVYQPFIQLEVPISEKVSLQDRLTQLGCNAQFAQLFSTSGQTCAFDRDFVLATLAFLCSRLLAPTRRARAASVIQKSWRRYWSKIEESRKQAKKHVAHACADLVAAREEANRPLADQEMIAQGMAEINLTQSVTRTYLKSNQTHGPISPSGSDDIWLNL